LVNALFLRWDVYNLKTVIRGKRAAAPIEEILMTTFPVGILDDVAVAELARVPTLQAVAGTLETWRLPLARPVRTGLNLLGEAESLHPLEWELDRFTFVQTVKLVANGDDDTLAVRNYLRFLVDKTNLLTALRYLAERSALSPIEASRQFLKAEGWLTRSHYEAVVSARDLRDGLSRLTETPYRWLAGTFAEGKPISLPLVERKFDHLAIRKAANLSRQDPLGIGVAIAYLEQKTNEVRNIRMILRGKALGMGVEQIAEWVMV
jgi:V/A-type H+-transporting ATPase subunit C